MHEKVRLIAIAFLFVTLAFFVGTAEAQIVPGEGMDAGLGGNNSITGVIYDPYGQRMSRRVQVRLSTQTRGDRISMTDDNGNFQFRGLVSGSYVLSIDKEKDYEPHTLAVEIIQLRGAPAQSMFLNVRLKARASAEGKPGVVDASFTILTESARSVYAEAQELARKGDHLGAAEKLRALTSEFPKFTVGFNDLGVAYLKIGDAASAEAAFRNALAIEPDSLAPLVNHGIALVSLRRYAEAEEQLRKALKFNDRLATAHYFLGQSQANQGKFDEAEKELSTSIKLGGDAMNEARRTLAIIYAARGERNRAAEVLEKYLKISPKAEDAPQLQERIVQLRQP